MSGPGGFVVSQTSTPRTKWTLSQITAAVPSSRGAFTFPTPYDTKAWRVTDSSDCSSGSADDIWYIGYSYWRNMNYHANSNDIKLFVGTKHTGCLLFTINKITDAITKVGPIFGAGELDSRGIPWRAWSGESWYWCHTLQDWMYIGDRLNWYRYNVVNHAQQLWINAVGMWSGVFGSDIEVYQPSSSADDNEHVFTLRRHNSPNTVLGIGYYKESTGATRFYDCPTANEAAISQNGRWTFVLEGSEAVGANRVYDNTTGAQIVRRFEQQGNLGHYAAGWDYFVGADNLNSDPNATVLWKAAPPTTWSYQGVMHRNYDWDLAALNHYALPKQTEGNYSNQLVYGSMADRSTYQNEVTVVRQNSSTDMLIVCPIMTDLDAAGGGTDDYGQFPKGNVDYSGEYFIWSTNLRGSRLDVFVVKVPTQKLLEPGSPDPPPSGIHIRRG